MRHGFVWSHIGWVLSKLGKPTNLDKVKELAKFPELRFLNKHHWIPALTGGVGMFFLGKGLESWSPQLGTDGPQMLVWGFFVSTFVLYHTTYSINSLTHVFGTRRYKTSDDSRNHWLFALITLGEGWHNNHHQFPSAARMGFFWYEFDGSAAGSLGFGLVGPELFEPDRHRRVLALGDPEQVNARRSARPPCIDVQARGSGQSPEVA